MNPRSTGLLFVVALALGVFIYAYEVPDADEGSDGEAASEGELFPGLDAGEIDWLTLTTEDGVQVEFERESGAAWQGTAPIEFDADQSALDAMASQLAQLEIEGRVAQPSGQGDVPSVELADFGLGPGFTEMRWSAAGKRYGLRIGRRTPVGAATYMTRIDQDEETVVYVATWRVNALRKPWLQLRDRRVLDFDHTSVTEIAASWQGGGVTLTKREGQWRITAPLDERADVETVETLLSDLAFLQADGFLENAPSGDAGPLDALGFAVELRGGEGMGDGASFVHRLRITGTHQGKRIAEREGGLRYLIAQERLDELPRRLLAYRYKRLADFVQADARRFTLTYDEGDGAREVVRGRLEASGWTTQPDVMAPARVGVMLAHLSRFEARDIVADDLGEAERAALGLAPPRLEIRVMGENDALLALVGLGLSDPERGVFAGRNDGGIVYRVAPEVIDWLPLDLATLRAEFIADLQDAVDADAEPAIGEWAPGEDMPLEGDVDAH